MTHSGLSLCAIPSSHLPVTEQVPLLLPKANHLQLVLFFKPVCLIPSYLLSTLGTVPGP